MAGGRSALGVPPSGWQASASGNAELALSTVPAGRSSALRMDFDFKGGKGFVVARHACPYAMPAEYAVHFRLRGRAPSNDLEVKLIDAAGVNVWRWVARDLRPSWRWRRWSVQSRDIEFAWGPSSGAALAELGFVELAIVAGEGGRGSLWLADLAIEDLTPAHAPAASASSAMPGFEAGEALGGAGWRPRVEERRPWISIDLGERRVIGGLVIDWLGGAPAAGFRLRASATGKRWKLVHAAARAAGARSYLYLPNLDTRLLRLDVAAPCAGARLRLQPFDFSRSIHAFWYALAGQEARGSHPRWLHREQSEWTPIGTAHGVDCALLDGDGRLEPAAGSFSLEPMLRIDGRLFTWADVAARQALEDRWVPNPSVVWETPRWRLTIRAQSCEGGAIRVSYRLENLTDDALPAELFVVVRPFQVTPPWQSFRSVGGVSRIHDLSFEEGTVRVDAKAQVLAVREARFGALTFDEGCIVPRLAAGELPADGAVHDAFGFATGALEFTLPLGPRAACERELICAGAQARPEASGLRSLDLRPFDWKARIAAGQWAGNGWAGEAIEAALTATAHILITRSGPALQPGPRRYTRSWIRDGAMMGAALLRMGHGAEVLEFIRWYAPHQREDGFVPCCVDREGVDWLVEHDSHGQLLALIADCHRFTREPGFLAQSWGFVERAAGYIEQALAGEESGLMPISVSHEGYLAQPVHAYWDDFWALRGLEDAADVARSLGRDDAALRWRASAARLRDALYTSIESVRACRKLDFLPGSLEWADFDPTATANAIYLFDVPSGLDRAAVERTFDAYLADWRAKRSGAVPAQNYTPYEIRIIGALVRLGRRDAALELLRFFLSDRRPPPWNQWPEIAWRDRRAPAHLGDLPHTWIAAEYVLALRSLFAYELESEHALILAAGVAPEWIEGAGVRVRAMPTAYGPLSYSLRKLDDRTLRFEIDSCACSRIILSPPLAAPLGALIVNGRTMPVDGGSIVLDRTPAEVLCVVH